VTNTSAVTIPVTINPTIDTSMIATALGSAVASALRSIAEQLDPTPVPPRFTPGQTVDEDELDELPVGAIVRDRDNDLCAKRPADHLGRDWTRNYSSPTDYPHLRARSIAAFSPLTLVSLPTPEEPTA
jgi:hypothetical protein